MRLYHETVQMVTDDQLLKKNLVYSADRKRPEIKTMYK